LLIICKGKNFIHSRRKTKAKLSYPMTKKV
jgi:hypothetical protein